jgi:ssDNA thymidine ADP-ribosyltransferase, DarT
VLDLDGVIVTDANASSDYTRFAPAPRGLAFVNYALTFAEWWTDPDPIQYFRRKSAKCAEVLVPRCVPPSFLIGAYVSCDEVLMQFNRLGVRLAAEIDRHLFFFR